MPIQNRIDYLTEEQAKIRDQMDHASMMDNLLAIADLQYRYGCITSELTWLIGIRAGLGFPHLWGPWSLEQHTIRIQISIPKVIVWCPLDHLITVEPFKLAWYYDPAILNDFPPGAAIGQLRATILKTVPELVRWRDAVRIANDLIPLLWEVRRYMGEALPLNIWEAMGPPNTRQELRNNASRWLSMDADNNPEIDTYRQQAGDNWDLVAELCATALITHQERYTWEPFGSAGVGGSVGVGGSG